MELDRLASEVQQFRIDSQRFFAGDLPVPPDELRERILDHLRRLRNDPGKGVAESFRLSSLEAQLNAQLELHGRRLRERERGGRSPHGDRAERAPDPQRGVVIGETPDDTAVAVLYKGLYLRDGDRTPQVGLEQFRGYIDRQAALVRQKTGCSEIHFRVALEEGKMKLKAKPIRPSRG